MKFRWLTGVLLFAIAFSVCAQASQRPARIVSLNMCLDDLLVRLAPREHIIAISHYSRDAWRTTIGPIGKELPVTYETAEEVVALKPDLVLTSRHSALATQDALKRVGIRFELFDVPMRISESLEQIRRLAVLLHEEERGAALVSEIERAIEAARPEPGTPKISAAVYQPGGLTAGSDTITDELMQVVGLTNIPAAKGIRQHRPMTLEMLIRDPPQVLLTPPVRRVAATQAEQVSQHPAILALKGRMLREPYSAKLLYCAGPTMIYALTALVAAREDAINVFAHEEVHN